MTPVEADAFPDAAGLAERLERATAGLDRTAPKARGLVLATLKEVRAGARERIEALLLENRRGDLCARRSSDLQDALIRAIHDFAVEHVVGAVNRSAAERMAIAAVGGYGRATLAPGSDIDLLFVLPYRQTAWGESVVEYILYMLWDLGLKVGHATRSIDECIRLSRADMTIRTAILEARFVHGEEPLYRDLVRRFDAEVVRGTGGEFIAAKLAERDERHRRQGTSRYLVEPNVKDGKGGLRDLQTLFWIAKYAFRVRDAADLVRLGVLSAEELRKFEKCDDFLWAVRCNMHFLAGRPEERLSFDIQRDIAERLGYAERAGLRSVERFMKHYFLVAKNVGDLTSIISAALENEHVKQAPGLGRFLRYFGRRPRALDGTTDFIVDKDRITVARPDAFERDPVNFLRLFHAADRTNLALHPDATKLVARSIKRVDGALRLDAEANRLFLEILTSRNDPETVLRRLNETGVLGRFIPDFGQVVAMMQFNMYHHYTVDEHLLRTVGELAGIEKGVRRDEYPLSAEIMPAIPNRRVLYVAAFLHDIGKGRVEDHSLYGARVARSLCPRLGLAPAETETVTWLVEHHLLMSMTAQSRDLSDRKTITDFAAVVQSIERLKLLLILTVADIRAVGPGVFNGWKGQLLRTLYYETEPVLTGGHTQAPRDQRAARARSELMAELGDWSEAERAAYAERHYPAYWLRVDPARKIAQAHFIREADRDGRKLAVEVRPRAREAVTEITVLAPDHPRLLSTVAGACAVAGANIVDAQIFTTTDGLAVDTISVSREFADDADETRRGERIAGLLTRALDGKERLPEQIERRAAAGRRTKAFELETEVVVSNAWSDRFTVIEVSGLDRPGLLYDLTRAISDLDLNIASAHIATFGERAADVFYVTDLTGEKIASPERQEAVRARLIAAFDGIKADVASTRPPAPTAV